MLKRAIGSLEVSVVGIGCNNFGRVIDAAETRRIVDAAIDHGIVFFDTADRYGEPATTSESFLGEALQGRRDRVVIATKFGRWLDATHGGARAAYVRAATEASLKRLRTDRIDLMQLHIPDPETPIEETLGALADLIAEGKIGEIGCSNFSAEELRKAADTAQAQGLPGFAATQAHYNVLHRKPVADLIAECERSEIRLVPFRPLYHGLLTGKYRAGSPPPQGTRIGDKDPERQAALLTPANLAGVAALTEYAEARGRTILELAFAWLLAQPLVPSIIAGVSSPGQVASNAAAAQWRLTGEELVEIDDVLAACGL